MTVIESEEYAKTRKRLKRDPIVQQMAAEIKVELDSPENREVFVRDDKPTWNFMTVANREYARRGGAKRSHIGGVAESILELIDEIPKEDPDA